MNQMKTNLLKGFMTTLLLIGMTGMASATTIVYHDGTHQLQGIKGVEMVLNGQTTSWDMESTALPAQFWDRYPAGGSYPYTSGFAETASHALYDLFNDDSAFYNYNRDPDNIWMVGTNPAYLITPYFIGNGRATGWQFTDGSFSNNSVQSVSNILLPTSVSSTYNHTVFLKWTESTTGGGSASPVPEPATLLLFSIGLLGLAGFARKKA